MIRVAGISGVTAGTFLKYFFQNRRNISRERTAEINDLTGKMFSGYLLLGLHEVKSTSKQINQDGR